MQKTLPILGLFAILFVGMISPAIAEGDDKWNDQYRQAEKEFEEKKYQIEDQFHEEFEDIEKHYEEVKSEIYEKINSNPELTDSEIDRMFDELYLEFDEKRQSIESEMWKQFEELEKEFQRQLQQIDAEAREFYESQEDRYNDDHFDDQYDDEYYNEDDHFESDDFKNYAPHESDPEWDSIEPLAKRIMDIIPMDKIQRLWEAGQLDAVIELIVSETDLSYEEAKRVVTFFEKYESQKPDRDEYPEHDYPRDNYPEPRHTSPVDNGEVLRLEQRILELERENQSLRDTIEELQDKVSQINAVVMEQIKFIYQWVLSQ